MGTADNNWTRLLGPVPKRGADSIQTASIQSQQSQRDTPAKREIALTVNCNELFAIAKKIIDHVIAGKSLTNAPAHTNANTQVCICAGLEDFASLRSGRRRHRLESFVAFGSIAGGQISRCRIGTAMTDVKVHDKCKTVTKIGKRGTKAGHILQWKKVLWNWP